jgi:tRNA modification GTPase
MDRPQTICALATPRAEGALGILRLSGPQALGLLKSLCHRETFSPRRMISVRLKHPQDGETLDHVMVCYMPGPNSFTGEDVVEVYGHGGVLNMERMLSVFMQLGARLADPGEFTRRAFLNGRMDLSQAEGVAQVIRARSERALNNAQAIVQGELGRKVGGIRKQIVELAAKLEADIDFADDDCVGVPLDELEREHVVIEDKIGLLASTYKQGRGQNGVSIAIVGPANVGKTSLFNKLLGSDRAIVSDEPGTTRDYLEAEIDIHGQRVILLDTPGQRSKTQLSLLEQTGLALATPQIEMCDLVISVVDLSEMRPHRQVVEQGERSLIIAANKADLITSSMVNKRVESLEALNIPLVVTSAINGTGLDRLREAVTQQLFDGSDGTETVQVTLNRQWEALLRARQAISEGRKALRQGLGPELVVEHSRGALGALGEITGEEYSEDILDTVFSTFCIGK